MSTELSQAVEALPLVDHHVHSCLRTTPTFAELEDLLSESDRRAPAGTTHLDSQIGFAVRQRCAPLLGLPPHCDAHDYWSARSELSTDEVSRRFLGAAGVVDWLLDTGHRGEDLFSLSEFAERAQSPVHEVVRLEALLEEVATTADATTLQERFREALQEAAQTAVGLKSIIAYRHGLDFDPVPPDRAAVRRAADAWLAGRQADTPPKVEDPVLLRMALWSGLETGLPVQLHVGFGDPDLDLYRCNPLLLTTWLKLIESMDSEIILLHCYPFHREAGFLAHVFPHVSFDVGLAVNYTGARSAAIIAESLELAPFGQVLYSSDAWGLPELHYLGASLWRSGIVASLTSWVDDGSWSLHDAVRVARMIGRENAERIYGLRHD